MHSGIPLTDEDRWPWLDLIGDWITETVAAGTVLWSPARLSGAPTVTCCAGDVPLSASSTCMTRRS